MEYKSYRYIYPPRPEKKIPKSYLKEFDDGSFLAQPKFNGDCGPVFFNTEKFLPMNRHNEPLTRWKLDPSELRELFQNDGWNVVVGEYMDKSKKDESKKTFNHKFVIFDILVLNSDYFLGKTFEDRWNLLYEMFKEQIISENEYSYQITENVWLVKSFFSEFDSIWEKLTQIDMIEGLVLKKRKSGLEKGTHEKNNLAQIKCRKSTRNYQY